MSVKQHLPWPVNGWTDKQNDKRMKVHPRIERARSIWRGFVCKLRGIDSEHDLIIDRKERVAEADEDEWWEMEMKDDSWDA
ncbi:MAG: hypothetical protein HUK20_00500 [Fibrobacter sp.]|nr:hypothetical protein [Fibrobacter sp.]